MAVTCSRLLGRVILDVTAPDVVSAIFNVVPPFGARKIVESSADKEMKYVELPSIVETAEPSQSPEAVTKSYFRTALLAAAGSAI
jgi:hypothetical protein